MKYVDLDQHGYFILDIKENAAQADWYFVDILDKYSEVESFGQGWQSEDAANHLIIASGASEGKQNAPDLAPSEISDVELSITNVKKRINALVLNSFPNPLRSGGKLNLNIAFNQTQDLSIDLVDMNGRVVKRLLQREVVSGNYALSFDLPELENGIYFLKIQTAESLPISKKIIIK